MRKIFATIAVAFMFQSVSSISTVSLCKCIVSIALALAALCSTGTGHAQQAAPQRFTVTTQGSGPDVILIPGLASPRDVYAKEATLLVPHYRLHLLQINGFGTQAAGVNASGPVLQPVVDELHTYILAQHLQHPAIIGHSMGGLAAMMLAVQHPDDAGKLLIVDSLPFIGLLFNPDATVAASEPMAAKIRDRMLTETEEEYAAGEQATMMRLVKNPEQRKIATGWVSVSDHKVVAQAMYDDFTTDIRPALGSIKVPVTVLYPWDSTAGPADRGRDLYTRAFAALPQVKLVPIDDSNHFIMQDQPAAFHAAVTGFLK